MKVRFDLHATWTMSGASARLRPGERFMIRRQPGLGPGGRSAGGRWRSAATAGVDRGGDLRRRSAGALGHAAMLSRCRSPAVRTCIGFTAFDDATPSAISASSARPVQMGRLSGCAAVRARAVAAAGAIARTAELGVGLHAAAHLLAAVGGAACSSMTPWKIRCRPCWRSVPGAAGRLLSAERRPALASSPICRRRDMAGLADEIAQCLRPAFRRRRNVWRPAGD